MAERDARSLGTPLTEGANYYAFHLTFNNRHRSDCPGCGQRATLTLKKITIESTDGAPPLELSGPDKKSTWVTIQAGGPCDIGDATRNPTWGQLKAIYR